MSDTPRTDAEVIQFGDGPAKYVYASFANKLEREILQLDVAIYNLKIGVASLQEAVDLLIEERDAYHDENVEISKDKQRLDWILEHCDVGYDKFYKTSFYNRDEIDQAMEGKQ
jgi:hypothetical protein